MTKKQKYRHIAVMCNELIKYLNLNRGGTVLDCTIGCGGHADAILQRIGPQGRLFGIDQDDQALQIATNRLRGFTNCILAKGNFRNIDAILGRLKIAHVDAIAFDLGISSLQLDTVTRGFSIKSDAPLDMRMDQDLRLSAFDLVNFLPQESLSDILKRYGQERWHNRIARAILRERKRTLIVSTGQLAQLVSRTVPARYTKIHPATRTFQALRIAVNDELEALYEGLNKCINYMRPGARIGVIAFHSLEDRIVKNEFRKFAREDKLRIITKKPLRPTAEEVGSNPRARSARLRVAERTNKWA
jgi:16S rRNA (cytosine1402-N4)-methyltransferase